MRLGREERNGAEMDKKREGGREGWRGALNHLSAARRGATCASVKRKGTSLILMTSKLEDFPGLFKGLGYTKARA